MSIASLLSKTPMFKTLDRLEDDLFARADGLHPTSISPVRFAIKKLFWANSPPHKTTRQQALDQKNHAD